MKKQPIIISIFAIIVAVYTLLSLLLTVTKEASFWIGFSFALLSLILLGILTLYSAMKKSNVFPVEISIITFSSLYVLVVLIINYLFCSLFKIEAKVFLSIHIMCFAIFAVITLLIYLAKSTISKQNSDASEKIYEQQILIYEIGRVKTKLSNFPDLIRNDAMNSIDELLEDMKFADFSSKSDLLDINDKIRAKTFSLLSEVDNIIEIQSDDLTAFNVTVNEIRQLVKTRDLQAKITNINI